jgi:hypothetical protein
MRVRFLERSIVEIVHAALAFSAASIRAFTGAWESVSSSLRWYHAVRQPRDRESPKRFPLLSWPGPLAQGASRPKENLYIVGGERDTSRQIEKTIELFEKWAAEEAYDLEVWPKLKAGIESHRLAERARFGDG